MSAYAVFSVVFGEQPSAAKWNILGTNDAYFNTQVGSLFGSGTTSTVWYEELGRTALGGAGDTITVSSLPARKFLLIYGILLNSGQLDTILRFNNDSAANYSAEGSTGFAAGADLLSQTSFALDPGTPSQNEYFVCEVFNNTANEKMGFTRILEAGATGGGTAPNGRIQNIKWANTSAQINRVDVINSGTGDFASGSVVVVLGHD